MFIEGMWSFYSLNEFGGTEAITITDVTVEGTDNICLHWSNEEYDEETFVFTMQDFNELFGHLLINGQYDSLRNRKIVIDFDIFFEDEDGNECFEPNVQINWIKNYSEDLIVF
ncbi:MAG: hypothetical protein ACLU4K_06505 [Oscillospiraceae bacterium]